MSDVVLAMRWYPFPPRTGSTVIASHTLPRLAERHRLHLVCAEKPESTEGADLFASVRWLEGGVRWRPIFTRMRMVVDVAGGVPGLVSKNQSAGMRALVDEAVARTGAEALLLFELWAVQYVPEGLWPRTVANIEDAQSLKLERMRHISGFSAPERAWMRLDAWACARYELAVLPRLGRVLLLSEADLADLRARHGLQNLRPVTYGVAVRDGCLARAAREPGRIVLSGNMWHPPNVDGACFFLEEVFPRVLAAVPDARLAIVGAHPARRIRAAARRFGRRVTITGQVPDVGAHLRAAIVGICPIRLKIGVQTKVLEALAWGTPVVTTSAGNSGVAGVDGRQLLVADAPTDFAARVVALLRGEGWEQLSAEGRRLVEDRFSWARSAAELEGYLDEVIRAR